MRLVEFLTHTTTPQQLVGFLKGKLGIDVAHYVLDENDGVIEMDPSIFDKIKYTVKNSMNYWTLMAGELEPIAIGHWF